LDCFTDTDSTFSNSPCPVFSVNDTRFTLTDDSSAPITFQRPTANSALLVAGLVDKLSNEPFHASGNRRAERTGITPPQKWYHALQGIYFIVAVLDGAPVVSGMSSAVRNLGTRTTWEDF
jgi:hypothetical protein